MDLNVKLKGLKYNFRKVGGVCAKFQGSGDFLYLLNYFCTKNDGIGPRCGGPSPRLQLTMVHRFH
jgi:hypothetical protein